MHRLRIKPYIGLHEQAHEEEEAQDTEDRCKE